MQDERITHARLHLTLCLHFLITRCRLMADVTCGIPTNGDGDGHGGGELKAYELNLLSKMASPDMADYL